MISTSTHLLQGPPFTPHQHRAAPWDEGQVQAHQSVAVLASPRGKREAVEYFMFALRVYISQTSVVLSKHKKWYLKSLLKGKVENAFNTVYW